MFDKKDDQLIATLANTDGYLSGNQLGSTLNMSRVAIRNRLRALADTGLPLQAKAATGYRLKEKFIPLARSAIIEHLPPQTTEKLLVSEVHVSLDSTNTRIESIPLNPNKACFVATEVQTNGKGRRANQWLATPFRNITLSLAWQFPLWPADITAFSLATGVLVADVLESKGITGIQLKWPNDLFLNGAKFAGILINIQGQSGGEARINCGIGINMALQSEDKRKIDQTCTDLSSEGYPDLNRNILIAGLINGWIDLCEKFVQQGFSPFNKRWHQLHMFQGQKVAAIKGENTIVGYAKGADAQGCLVIEDIDNRQTRLVDPDYSLKMA